MKILIATTTAAALTLGAGPALAGGLTEPVAVVAPTPVPVVTAPVPTGANWTGLYVGGQIGFGELSFDGVDDSAADLTGFGVHAGYLYDLGSVVLGAEADYDWIEVDGADGTDNVLRLKGIAGYDAGAFLPYATAGLAQLQPETGDDSDGHFYGLGLAYQVSDSIRVGGEVLQHRFDEFGGGTDDLDVTTGSLRVSFTF